LVNHILPLGVLFSISYVELTLITSQTSAATAVTDYILQDSSAAGLRLPSAFRSFLVTLPRSAIIARIGKLSDTDWQAVRERVRLALAQP